MALNSNSEYDRCKIHRLTIGKEDVYQKGGEQQLVGTSVGGVDGAQGERYLMDRRKHMDRNNYVGTGLTTTLSQKRGNMGESLRREICTCWGTMGGPEQKPWT